MSEGGCVGIKINGVFVHVARVKDFSDWSKTNNNSNVEKVRGQHSRRGNGKYCEYYSKNIILLIYFDYILALLSVVESYHKYSFLSTLDYILRICTYEIPYFIQC